MSEVIAPPTTLDALTQGIVEIFGGLSEAGEKILTAVLTHDLERLNACAALLAADWGVDLLQRVYQYHLADREEKKQDFTPPTIGRLLAQVTPQQRTIYDLCAGSGSLTIQKWSQNPDALFICEEMDSEVIPFLLLNLVVRNISGYVIQRNALTLETRAVYQLQATGQYSSVTEIDEPPTIEADAILSNPPYNIPWQPPDPLFADGRFTTLGIPNKGNANFAFVLTAISRLKRGGKCAFILPMGILTSSNERDIRKGLIDAGMLETVICLPDSMFESTGIPVCVLILGDGQDTQGRVNVLDCRKFYDVETRYQNGQYGGASHERRTYRKEMKVFSDARISEIIEAFGQNIPGLAACPTIGEIAQQDYILTPSRYISQVEQTQTHRPYEDIIDDINRICRERNVIKITANEKLARELGLDEIHRLQEDGNKNIADINKTFSLFGKKAIPSSFVGLSKNKNELRIENQDKELLSSLLAIFLPMWQQHIYYLNLEENRLLAELRDALLPDLMSGKISVSEEERNHD